MAQFLNVSWIFFLLFYGYCCQGQTPGKNFSSSHGAIIRGDKADKKIALVFTGDEFGDGGEAIANTLQQQKIKASFFLTGNFYRNPEFKSVLLKLQQQGNYLGTHSDQHLLYCDWTNRDSLLVTHLQFNQDLENAFKEMKKWDISKEKANYFLPPYEWYNDTIARWAREFGLQLVCFTPGTRSNADYTYPEMGSKYLSTDSVMQSIRQYEMTSPDGLNGFVLLLHIGTDPRRTDKSYSQLPGLILALKGKEYHFVTMNDLLR